MDLVRYGPTARLFVYLFVYTCVSLTTLLSQTAFYEKKKKNCCEIQISENRMANLEEFSREAVAQKGLFC
jgi:hypothetical protein